MSSIIWHDAILSLQINFLFGRAKLAENEMQFR